MCQDAGVLLVYLPPYSPDFNPIEQSFAELKAWLKKNQVLLNGFEGNSGFEGFLRLGLETLSQKAGTHFRSCHIGLEEDENED